MRIFCLSYTKTHSCCSTACIICKILHVTEQNKKFYGSERFLLAFTDYQFGIGSLSISVCHDTVHVVSQIHCFSHAAETETLEKTGSVTAVWTTPSLVLIQTVNPQSLSESNFSASCFVLFCFLDELFWIISGWCFCSIVVSNHFFCTLSYHAA